MVLPFRMFRLFPPWQKPCTMVSENGNVVHKGSLLRTKRTLFEGLLIGDDRMRLLFIVLTLSGSMLLPVFVAAAEAPVGTESLRRFFVAPQAPLLPGEVPDEA